MGRKHGMIRLWFAVALLAGLPAGGTAGENQGLSFKFGLSERIRNEYYNNISDMNKAKDDRTDYFRVRTSVWGQARYAPVATVYLKLTNEFRKYMIDPKDRDFTWDEIVCDNLYLKLESPCKAASLTIGRQNLNYGEGFILLEGGPWDGSRTIYHDAAKLSVKRGKTAVDLLAIDNARFDDRLPLIRGAELSDGKLKAQTPDQWMNDGREKAFGAYVTTTALPRMKTEAYFIRKTEDPEPWINRGGPSDRLDLNTLGARVQVTVNEKWSVTGEWAGQTGAQGAIDHRAFGGYAYAAYSVDAASKSSISAGAICLSGDDPATPDNEGWNPLFSRWPKWSELYIYAHLNEVIRGSTRVAYWTNIWAPYVSYTMQFTKKASLNGNFYLLRAFENRMVPGGGTGSGLNRGKEVQFWLRYTYNKYVSGHILLDQLVPGDFYAFPRTAGPFCRAELFINL
ncbi:MAG: alginate export family protein [bacterium]|nr:alginate export family protein [bacterium]